MPKFQDEDPAPVDRPTIRKKTSVQATVQSLEGEKKLKAPKEGADGRQKDSTSPGATTKRSKIPVRHGNEEQKPQN